MSDDTSYQSFLERANQPVGGGKETSSSQQKSEFDPTLTPVSSAVPEVLRALQSPDGHPVVYTSDTDAPFEAVVLSYAGAGMPDGKELGKCVGVSGADVEVLSVDGFDPQGKYGAVVDMVRQAGREKGGDGQVKVYRISRGKTRCEYYVLTLMKEGGGGLIGARARAVES